MRKIALGGAKARGLVVWVDEADYERLRTYKWHLNGGYAEHSEFRGKALSPKKFKLHHLLVGQRPGFVVDHKNGNTLDNRRDNLRFVTRSQNKLNSSKRQTHPSSIFKGVSFRFKKYWPRIQVNGKRVCIGGFVSELAAAMAYDLWAIDLAPDHARPNFIFTLHSQIKKPAA